MQKVRLSLFLIFAFASYLFIATPLGAETLKIGGTGAALGVTERSVTHK